MHVRIEISSGRQAMALVSLAVRLGDARAKNAIEQLTLALATWRDGGYASAASYFETQLTRARSLSNQLSDGWRRTDPRIPVRNGLPSIDRSRWPELTATAYRSSSRAYAPK